MYKKGDRVLAFHGPMLYEAQILKLNEDKEPNEEMLYFVHYRGWKPTWDEWVPQDRMLEINEENLKTQKELRQALMANRPTKKSASGAKSATPTKEDTPGTHGRGQKRVREAGEVEKEEEHARKPEIRLTMPDILKSQLVDDWENVTKNQQKVPLPRTPNVSQIVDDYAKTQTKKRQGSAEAEIFSEFMAGVKIYFDRCLGNLLLYRFERQQYLEVKKDKNLRSKPMSEVYGAEHLLRLFVSMPELIAHTNMDHQSVQILRQHLEDFLQYLAKHRSSLFLQSYENASPNYQSLSRGV